jgi:hypothetical protein
VKAAREDWFDGQTDLDPEHLIFIDESGLSADSDEGAQAFRFNGARGSDLMSPGAWSLAGW